MIRKISAIVLAVSVVSCVPAAHAQTGPINSVPSNSASDNTQVLTEQTMSGFLRSLGYQVQTRTESGSTVFSFLGPKNRTFEVTVTKNRNGSTDGYYFRVPLTTVGSDVSSAQLLAVLGSNMNIKPMYYAYRSSDHKLLMVLEHPFRGISAKTARINLDVMAKVIDREASTWNLSGTGSPSNNPGIVTEVPQINPVQPADQPAVQPVVQLAQSTWSGKENLNGYGQVAFEFVDGQRVVMIDKDGRTSGTYVRNGNQVTITFRYQNGSSVIYAGTLEGTTLQGTATNGKARWTFAIQR